MQTLRKLGRAVALASLYVAGQGVARPAEVQSEKARADELLLLKGQIALQQKQIEQLRVAMEKQKCLLERLLENSQAASSVARVEGAVEASEGPAGAAEAGEGVGEASSVSGSLDPGSAQLAAVAANASPTSPRVAKPDSDSTRSEKKPEVKLGILGNVQVSGDIRLRFESLSQDTVPSRQRERARVRLNFASKLTDEISAGISFNTGEREELNSPNQTMTGFFTRKTVGFDRYYVAYNPKAFRPLTLAGGKFSYPWVRTPMTFDNDINPEGLAETLSFNLQNGTLQNVTLVGFQLPFNEARAAYDSAVFGGQLQTTWRFGDRLKLGLYAAGVNINRPDPIAVAIAGGTLRPSQADSNTLRTDAEGNVLGYASRFAYLDLLARAEYGWTRRWPVTALFNFVNNTRAATRQRKGYWSELTFGRVKEAGDMQFGYAFMRIEKDAVIGAFNESELRSSTNLRGHRLQFGYQPVSSLSLEWLLWLGKLANPAENPDLVPAGARAACTAPPFSGCHDSTVHRLQFDVTYKF